MTIEASLFDVLKGLVNNRVYDYLAPADVTAAQKAAGYITFLMAGGTSYNYLEGGPVGLRTPRVQINSYHGTREGAKALALQVDSTMRAATELQTEVLGEPVAAHEPDPNLFAMRQDFRVTAP